MLRISDAPGRERMDRILNVAIASAILVAGIILSLSSYQKIGLAPDIIFFELSLYLSAFCIPILLGWFAFQRVGAVIFVILSSILAVLDALICGRHEFILFLLCYVGMIALFYWVDKQQSNEVVVREVDLEKQMVEKNDLELNFKEKGKNISICFEKYSTHYNLRRLAEEFSTTLDLTHLGDLIVNRTLEFIQKGDVCLLFLAQSDKDGVSLLASKSTDSARKVMKKLGDLFDFWVLRNRQHLLILDTQKDFRFDLKKVTWLDNVRSAILSPVVLEGKVTGALRVNANHPDVFNTDHLRLLDAISTLASSAISNAILYKKTEELAIRDSLTQLYVQHYFLERLREEHKRALLMHRSLSLLLLDLDHFKELNDQYGHAIGDLVLVRFAEVLRSFFEHGIIARYGGEEFTVLLPHVTKPEAHRLAEKIRKSLLNEQIDIRREKVQLTTSIGVATVPDDTLDSEELIQLADQRLYQAKRSGRNQVC